MRSAPSRAPRKRKSESMQTTHIRTKKHRVLRVRSKRHRKQPVPPEGLTLHTNENGRFGATGRTLDSGKAIRGRGIWSETLTCIEDTLEGDLSSGSVASALSHARKKRSTSENSPLRSLIPEKANEKRTLPRSPVGVEKVSIQPKWPKFRGWKMSCNSRRSLIAHRDAFYFREFREKEFFNSHAWLQ